MSHELHMWTAIRMPKQQYMLSIAAPACLQVDLWCLYTTAEDPLCQGLLCYSDLRREHSVSDSKISIDQSINQSISLHLKLTRAPKSRAGHALGFSGSQVAQNASAIAAFGTIAAA